MTASKTQRLYLVDAHAYLHRAYHALPPLKTSKGEPVGALFGFARMLQVLLKREKPECLIVCFDMPGPTFRHKAYAQYKATRKEIDGDLKSQLALAMPMAEAMGLRCLGAEGFEADDLMATLARRAVSRGLDVVLVTGDKDALQLVGERVKVLNEAKGEWFDAQKVLEKFNVRPGQIVDYLSLIGDSSDNVPGVPGIGSAGAVKLLARYGSLDALLQAARARDPGLPPKLAKALSESQEKALFGRTLLELDASAPVEESPERCAVKPADPAVLIPLFERLEFFSLLKELLPDYSAAVGDGPISVSGTWSAPAPPKPLPLGAWLERAAGAREIAVAFCPASEEISSSQPGLPLPACWTLGLSLPEGPVCLADAQKAGAHDGLARLLGDPKVGKLGHDLKAVFSSLAESGTRAAGARFDSMLAAYCLSPGQAKYEFASVWRLAGAQPLPAGEESRAAALRQAAAFWKLREELKRRLEDARVLELYEGLEMPLVEVLASMESRGVAVDAPYLIRLQEEFQGRIAEVKRELDAMAGAELNLNSPRQLGKLLFEDLKLPVIRKTPKGGVSTDEETLRALTSLHPIPAKIIEYRELAKLKSTYVDALLERRDPRTGRVHTRFNQAGTATGRLSSVEPNLQNIPIRSPLGQKIRRGFVPAPGNLLVSCDYSQIDLRVLAHLSEDPELCGAYRKGVDVHLKTACEVFGVEPEAVDSEMRRRAKAVNFGIVYGQTPFGLGQELGIPVAAAKQYIERYQARYRGVAEWSRRNLESARRDGFVRTLLGRVRFLPDLSAKNTAVRQFNERAAGNTPIQGTTADIIKVAMLNIHRKLGSEAAAKGAVLLLQVHDDLLFECPAEKAEAFARWARREMEEALRLRVPLVVEAKIGANWQDLRPVRET